MVPHNLSPLKSIACLIVIAVSLSACATGPFSNLGESAALKESDAKTYASKQPVKLKKASSKKKSGKPYNEIISRHAKANGVPVPLAHAVVFSESSYKAGARGAVGEIGLMQLRLPTARLVGYKGSAKALYAPETNIKYGMKYLGKAHKMAGGNTCGTILRYNAGLGAKRMNPISARYCKKVKRILR